MNREWYHAAQSAPSLDLTPHKSQWSDNTIIEEEDESEQSNTKKDTGATTQRPEPQPRDLPRMESESRAVAELRIHELLALFACFLSPVLGGWLLHAIRSQLSRPSEGLVSNYNLTVFLLASEIRPLSHLIKIVQARTLYLQRTVGADTHGDPNLGVHAITDMAKRLDELEAFVSQSSAPGKAPDAVSGDRIQIKNEVRNSLQPDLDALNRAVRRYEKRMVALTMQTESRLQELDSRMSDAITLAAASERSSTQQRSRRGSSALILVDWMSSAVLLPLRAAWVTISFPAKLLSMLMGTVEEYVGNKVRREMRTAGRTSGGHGRKSNPGSTKVKKAM